MCCQKVSGGYWSVGYVSRVNTGEGTFRGLVTAEGRKIYALMRVHKIYTHLYRTQPWCQS